MFATSCHTQSGGLACARQKRFVPFSKQTRPLWHSDHGPQTRRAYDRIDQKPTAKLPSMQATSNKAELTLLDTFLSLPYPPCTPLAGSEAGSFAHDTISKRLPFIVANIISEVKDVAAKHPGDKVDAAPLVAALETIQHEMRTNGAVSPVVDAPAQKSPDSADFSQIVEWTNTSLHAYKTSKGQSTWWDLPWLVVECYLYVRMAAAFRSHASPFGAAFDPFATQKQAAAEKSRAAAVDVAAAVWKLVEQLPGDGSLGETVRSGLFEAMQYSLWGNKTDLSLLVDAAAVNPQQLTAAASSSSSPTPFLIVDDFKAVWDYLAPPRSGVSGALPRQVDIILDNAGLELYVDLCLAHYLTASGLADKVVFHGKQLPWFVSDTLEGDFFGTIKSCAEDPDEPTKLLAEQWQSYIDSGVWTYTTHPFWTCPLPFCWMDAASPDLHAQLQSSFLLVFKGDLNYRKLAYDCRWPVTTPFETALCGFQPAPLLSLRTLKADVMAGLVAGQAEVLDGVDKDWMVNGKFGIVQAVL